MIDVVPEVMPRYPADLYAATHTGTPGDLSFYRALCAPGGEVLELGCGYGRVLEALATLPGRKVGIDLDADLVERARSRLRGYEAVECGVADMRTFCLDHRFDRVLLPHSGIYCLLSEEDVLATLRAARAHLSPGGIFALDGYCADAFHASSHADDINDHTLIPIARIEARGTTWQVFERSRWEPATQRILATYIYRAEDSDAQEEGIIDQRYILRPQLVALLQRAGFEDIKLAGSFAGDPVTDDDDIWVAHATAPAGP